MAVRHATAKRDFSDLAGRIDFVGSGKAGYSALAQGRKAGWPAHVTARLRPQAVTARLRPPVFMSKGGDRKDAKAAKVKKAQLGIGRKILGRKIEKDGESRMVELRMAGE